MPIVLRRLSLTLVAALGVLAQTQTPPAQTPVPKEPLVLVLIGPPGSGKTTQAAFLTRKLRLPVVAVDELQATGPGVDAALRTRVQKPDAAAGFILDGYPATRAQADFLTALVKELKLSSPLIVQIDVKDEVVRQRLAQSARPEDKGEGLEKRLATYHKELDLVRSYYPQADIWTINGHRTARDVSDTILSLLADRN